MAVSPVLGCTEGSGLQCDVQGVNGLCCDVQGVVNGQWGDRTVQLFVCGELVTECPKRIVLDTKLLQCK